MGGSAFGGPPIPMSSRSRLHNREQENLSMATRIGVDVGGTFTDLIFYDDETGEIRVGKEPTTPAAPQDGVLNAVEAAVPQGRVGAAEYFLHGTTVGLNSLLTRTGAVVGLLATRGFRDILEVRRGDRDDPYDLFWKHPPPLVPRHLWIPVTERMYADGTVHTPFEKDAIREAVKIFAADGVTSVAVAFLHAYANPAHELAAEQALREFGFVQPVLARRADHVVVGGHQRLLAARKLGMRTVPVIYLDLSVEQSHVLNLALNQISGEWDEDLLAQLLNLNLAVSEREKAGDPVTAPGVPPGASNRRRDERALRSSRAQADPASRHVCGRHDQNTHA